MTEENTKKRTYEGVDKTQLNDEDFACAFVRDMCFLGCLKGFAGDVSEWFIEQQIQRCIKDFKEKKLPSKDVARYAGKLFGYCDWKREEILDYVKRCGYEPEKRSVYNIFAGNCIWAWIIPFGGKGQCHHYLFSCPIEKKRRLETVAIEKSKVPNDEQTKKE